MLKAGILTSHGSMNYGGLLQAYALQEKFKEMGCEYAIINYKPQMHDIKKHPVSFVMQRKGIISRSIFTLKNYAAFKSRVQIINTFRSENFNCSPKESLTKDEIKAEADKYDIVCCGSDQLWNISQKDNENRAYMLDYERKNFTMSYAISFGDGLKTKRQELIESIGLIKRFDVVSVRDEASAKFLQGQGVEATVALDPTLLIDEKFWEKFRSKAIIDHPYILIYGFENANQNYSDMINVARRFSKALKMPVVNVLMNPKIAKRDFEKFFACGPKEFLNLIQNASLVCTNSFHASIFSIIYGRPFVSVFGDTGEKDIRKAALLSMLGLESRAVTPSTKWKLNEIMAVDYSDAINRIHELRKESCNFLEKAISDAEKKQGM